MIALNIEFTKAYVVVTGLLLISPLVYASEETMHWTSYLFIGLVISIVAAFFLVKRTQTSEGLGIKILLGCLYFWVVTFAQLMVLGIVYSLQS